MVRIYGVDISAFQGTSVAAYVNAGTKYVIVKASEGTTYRNPKAVYQIKSAHAHHIYIHAYHFATFGNSVSRAKLEAKYFIATAKSLNISKKRYLWLDWETGDGNVVTGSRAANTRAIIAFMDKCHKAGYKVGLYSGASLLRNNINTKDIIDKYGDCLWVASYATMDRIDVPNFNYFPSMNGVAIWQFTDNWCGLNVDGNIALIDLHKDGKATASKVEHEATQKPAPKKHTVPSKVYAPVINGNPNYMIQLLDSDGHYTGKYIRTNTSWKVFGEKNIKGMKCYKLGTEKQYVPAKYVKII